MKSTKSEIQRLGVKCHAYKCDIGNRLEVYKLVVTAL